MSKAKPVAASRGRRRREKQQACSNDLPPSTEQQAAAKIADGDSDRCSLEDFVIDRKRQSNRGSRHHMPQAEQFIAPVIAVADKGDSNRSKCSWPYRGLPPIPANDLCSSLLERQHPSWQRLRSGIHLSHALMCRSSGLNFAVRQNRQTIDMPVINRLDRYSVLHLATPFMRRVTAMAWHPLLANLLAVGSKGGELVLWRVDKEQQPEVTDMGIGPGGVVQSMKFWPPKEHSLLSATMDSGIVLRDLERKSHRILFNSDDPYERWFCSVDATTSIIAGGESRGELVLLSANDGTKTFSARLHKNKITHVEFSPKDENLICTASVDRTVRMWDIRQMKDKSSALYVLPHDKGINAACFSRTDGCRLLTTDQHDQLRVYVGPDWRLERTIEHPHRFFQHLTPIKASWHPLVDVAMIGRYPLDKDGVNMRRLDMYRVDNGELTSFLRHSLVVGISSLNCFNPTAEYIATGMGSTIVIWKQELSVPDNEVEEPAPASGPSPGGGHRKDPKQLPKRSRASKQEAAAAKAKLARKE